VQKPHPQGWGFLLVQLRLADPVKMGLLLCRPVHVFNDKHQEVLADVRIAQPFQHLVVIQTTLPQVVSDLHQRPPFPIQLFSWKKDEGSTLPGVVTLVAPERVIGGEVRKALRYQIGMGQSVAVRSDIRTDRNIVTIVERT